MNYEALDTIHNNLVNGNRRDCVKMIEDYMLYEFWADYARYLKDNYADVKKQYEYFTDMTVSYFRITNR